MPDLINYQYLIWSIGCGGVQQILQEAVSISTMDSPTGRRTIPLMTNNMEGWSVARSDGPSPGRMVRHAY